MSKPMEVSKKAYDSFEGEKWNALIELISWAELDELTRVQRVAHFAWWYSSEVLNGGHEQYFGNKDYFDHIEVINCLETMGAKCQGNVLKEAMAYFTKAQKEMPDGYEEYVVWDKKYGYSNQMSIFDQQFYNCRPEIEVELLDAYLNTYEYEFIKWIE